jgi:hypothetical protein
MKDNNIYYFKLIAESLKNELNLNVSIHFKDINRGFSSAKGYISIPLWALNNKYYGIYYIIHELTHQIIYNNFGHFRHNEQFKTKERELLYKFNLIPIYAKAYVKKLLLNNVVVYLQLSK